MRKSRRSQGGEPTPAWYPYGPENEPVRWDGPMEVTKDGRNWQIGTATEVAWISGATTGERTITAAVPPVFEAYATFHELDVDAVSVVGHERSVIGHLATASGDQPWWLGYLDTGAHDIVFPHAPKVRLYWGWEYVLVLAGAEQAMTWRAGHMRSQHGTLPDLFFPVDRSWLVSALWDDAWTCAGGPEALIDRQCHDPRVRARRVRPDEDATPPGRELL